MKTNDNIYKEMEKLDDIIEGPPAIIRNKIYHDWWKYAGAILFAICMVLECVNMGIIWHSHLDVRILKL